MKTTKPTVKTAAKKVASINLEKKAKVAVTKSVPKAAATKSGTEVTTAQKVREFVTATFADKNIESPRAVCINHFQKEFGMRKTTASTYFGNAIRALLTAEQKAAEERLAAGKPVWSAYKLNDKNEVTSFGMFISASSANEFNELFRHNGVAKGALEIGAVIAKPAKKSKAA